MSKRSLLARLTGWPMIKVPYRAHWRVMINAHQLILKLIEDNEDGDKRGLAAPWVAGELAPVVTLQTSMSIRP